MARDTKRRKYDPPIALCDQIPGTNLRRRYQAGRELYPIYVGPEKTAGERKAAAEAQCEAQGIGGYYDGLSDETCVRLSGAWYCAFFGRTLQAPREGVRRG
jgi:hypothetical protein